MPQRNVRMFHALLGNATGIDDIDNNFSMEFDGADDYMTTGINLGYTSYPNLSLSCWIKVDNSDLVDFTDYSPIGAYVAGYANSTPINLNHSSAAFPPELKVAQQGAAPTVYGTTELGDGNWHHIVSTCEYDAAGTIVNVYVDGNPTPEIANNLMLSYTPITGDLILGAATSTFRRFIGKVDEIAAFDYILSTGDIEDIYNATSAGTPDKTADLSSMSTPPIAWYRMGD